MHSDVMASAPMLVETVYNDMKRGRVSRLNGLWDLCCSSAALDPRMLLELAQNGFVVNQCYGMTETFGDGILNFTQVEKHMSAVGKPDDHVQYKLDETGEICIKGDCVMLGYYKDPEATAEVIDATAGSTPATWPGWMRKASITSPAARRTSSSSPAARTSALKSWKRSWPSARPSPSAS